MKKRGLLHVDWVISMGIFLIYIFTFLIFLRPTLQTTTPHETIAALVIDKLNEDARITLERTPIFLDTLRPTNISFPFDGLETNYLITNKDGLPINFKIIEISGKRKLLFNPSTNPMWVLYSSETVSSEAYTCPSEGCQGLSSSEYSYGATEKITGLSLAKLEQLKNIDNIKEQWGISEQDEFIISIRDENTELYRLETQPSEQEIRIYVREYKDFILDPSTGQKNKVVVNVRVW